MLDTAHEGDVLGWSWLVPPYRWRFDARATEETSAIAFDGRACAASARPIPRSATRCCSGSSQVMSRRLQSARVRLLDLYGRQP